MYRFAPSPTGDMYIGNLRAALIDYICSKQEKADFTLRIEDTDKAKSTAGKEGEIQEILRLFGISWQHYYMQSENLKFYRQMALKLVSEKRAFACFCTEDELNAKREEVKRPDKPYRYDGTCERLQDIEILGNKKPFVICLKKLEKAMKFKDSIRRELCFEPENTDSFVIMRADKTPTYNFACAVDDMLERVSCTIRGEGHVSNTPKQGHIRTSLNYEKAMTYAHLPIILNGERQKMSKREAHPNVKWLLESGILSSAVANYLLLLGNKTPCETFTLDEAILWFDLIKLPKALVKFGLRKLLQLNREYIKKLDDASLNVLLKTDKNLAPLAKFYIQEASTLVELREELDVIFGPKDYREFEEESFILKEALEKCELKESYEEFKRELIKLSGLKGKNFFTPLKIMLTGSTHGPELNELYPHLKPFIKELARKA